MLAASGRLPATTPEGVASGKLDKVKVKVLRPADYTPASLPKTPQDYDTRIKWVKSKVESGLFVDFDPANSNQTNTDGLPIDLFEECLERDGRKSLQDLMDFLEDNVHCSALVFWTETFQKKVEQKRLKQQQTEQQSAIVDVTNTEAVAPSSELQPATESASTQPTETPVPAAQETEQQPSEAASAPAPSSTDVPAAAPVEGAPQSQPTTTSEAKPAAEPEYEVYITTVEETRLQMYLQEVPTKINELNAMFFLRNVSGKIELPRNMTGKLIEVARLPVFY